MLPRTPLAAALACLCVSIAQSQSTGLSFDGVDDHALISKWPTLPSQNFTICLWVRLPSVPSSEQTLVAFSQDQSQSRTPWSLRIGDQSPTGDPSRVFLKYENFNGQTTGYADTAGPSLTPGVWTFLGVSVSSSLGLGGELLYSVDDAQVIPAQRIPILPKYVPVTALKSNGPMLIGADSAGGLGADSAYFQGEIDDLQIWNRALSAPELAALYSRVPDTTTPGLVGYWKFEDAVGQTLVDCAIPSNNGFLGAGSATGADDPSRQPASAPVPSTLPALGFQFPEPNPTLGIFPPTISVVPGPGGYAAILNNAPTNALYALVAAPSAEFLQLELLFAISPGLVLVPNLASAQAVQTGFTTPLGQAAAFLPTFPASCSQIYVQFAVFSAVPVLSINDIWMSEAVLIQNP
jgi:hypothetical protein